MAKLEVTVVIPSVKRAEDCHIMTTFLLSEVTDKLYVQFVFLSNPKTVDHSSQTTLTNFDTHELLFVGNDRFIGTCDENLFRTQDFCGMFKSRVFWIGEHDFIDWDSLYRAVQFANANRVDVLGWNFAYSELLEDGASSTKMALPRLDGQTLCNVMVNSLADGQVFESAIGYFAMISTYGPTDWAGFIGSHMFTREAYARLLAFKSLEPIYSCTFKLIRFSTEYDATYALFNHPVVIRFSDDHVKRRNGVVSTGSLDRRAAGNSPSVVFGFIIHLLEIEDDAVFNLLLNSMCIATVPDASGNLEYQRNPMLQHVLGFVDTALAYKLSGTSHYVDGLGNSSLQDLWFVRLFLLRVVALMSEASHIYEGFDESLGALLSEVAELLSVYFFSMRGGDDLLRAAGERIARAGLALKWEALFAANERSFLIFLESRRSPQAGFRRGFSGRRNQIAC